MNELKIFQYSSTIYKTIESTFLHQNDQYILMSQMDPDIFFDTQ